jgi:DNA-binding CsgD family transcriptional regulator
MAKWLEETEKALVDAVSAFNGEIPYTECERIASELGKPTASVTAKLRALDYKVGKKEATKSESSYSDEDVATIKAMAEAGSYLEEIADTLGRDPKSVKGKLLSMRLKVTQRDVKPAKPKAYTEAEEAIITEMHAAGATKIAIAERLNRTIQQVSGKLLSMKLFGLESGVDKSANAKPKVYTEEVIETIKTRVANGESLDDIAESLSLNARGLKTQAAKLGIVAKVQKAKFWTEEKVAELLNKFDTTKDDIGAIAVAIGSTMPAVAKKLKEMGRNYDTRKPAKKSEQE